MIKNEIVANPTEETTILARKRSICYASAQMILVLCLMLSYCLSVNEMCDDLLLCGNYKWTKKKSN